MDLTDLAAFHLVATHGGFGRASRASGQSKATLSRRVRDLEQGLGVRLIERGARALRLTDEGADLHARTHGPLLEVEEAGSEIAAGRSQPRGTLRVSAPVLFSHIAMGRIAAGFVKTFPEVVLETVAEDRHADPVEDGYDVVIRINPRPDHELIGRVFFRDEILMVASPSSPRPSGGGEPPEYPAVLLHGAPEAPIWRCSADGVDRQIRPLPRLRLSSLLIVRDAVLAGAGVALLPRSLVADDLAGGRLSEWGVVTDRPIEGWALHTSRRLTSPKVSAFMRFLGETFPDGLLVAP